MPDDTVPYQFPTSSDAADWCAKVQAAVGHSLMWTRATEQGPGWWLLSGPCPHCGHRMSQLFKLKGGVILPDTFGSAEVKVVGQQVKIEIVCNCSGGHKKDVEGCGFGKGIEVPLQRPE